MGIERVGVYMKPGQLQAAETVQGLVEWLGERGIEVRGDQEAARITGEPGIARDELAKQIDLAVALGGTARCCPSRGPSAPARSRFSGSTSAPSVS